MCPKRIAATKMVTEGECAHKCIPYVLQPQNNFDMTE